MNMKKEYILPTCEIVHVEEMLMSDFSGDINKPKEENPDWGDLPTT